MANKETKSERIFRHKFFEAKSAIKSSGAGKIHALSDLHDGTDERICQRTVNDIRKHAKRLLKDIEWDICYCVNKPIFDTEDYEAVVIVLNTCTKWEREQASAKVHFSAL